MARLNIKTLICSASQLENKISFKQVLNITRIEHVMKLAADGSVSLGCCKKFEKVVPNIIATLSEFHLVIAKDGLSEAILP